MNGGGIVGAPLAEARAGEIRGGHEAVVHQRVEGNQERVAGKGGKGLIRRIGKAGRPQGQHLPQGLPGLRQELNKAHGLRAEVADAMAAGKRGGVQQDATLTREAHTFGV